MPGEGLRIRALALLTSLISLIGSVVFSVAVTRKLPLVDVGFLNIFTAAVSLGTIPATVISFASPRLAAKYRAAEVGVLAASAALSAAGAAVGVAYLLGLGPKVAGRYLDLMLILSSLSSFTSSLSAASAGFLVALDRPRMLYTTLVTSIVKLASIYYIMESSWSLQSVLISSFAIYASGLAYSMAAASPYFSASMGIRRPLKEVMSGAWVPLLGYASNNLRSLDTMFIAALGGIIDNAIWQVIYMVGKVYGFVGNLINVSYGELLTREGNRIYYDLLLILYTTTAISLAVVAFEPYVVEFLRPRDPYLIPELAAPIALWAAGNVLGSFSQFVSAVMQGVDRVDMGGEISARTYLGSLVLRAHNAELLMTLSYLALIYPSMEAARAASLNLYAIYGVVIAGIAANAAATAYRLAGLRNAAEILGVRGLPRDYALPTAVAAAALAALRGPIMAAMRPTPSAAWGALELAAAFAIAGGAYLAGAATSPRARRLISLALRRAGELLP